RSTPTRMGNVVSHRGSRSRTYPLRASRRLASDSARQAGSISRPDRGAVSNALHHSAARTGRALPTSFDRPTSGKATGGSPRLRAAPSRICEGVFDLTLFRALDRVPRPGSVERSHQSQPGLLHGPPGAGVD